MQPIKEKVTFSKFSVILSAVLTVGLAILLVINGEQNPDIVFTITAIALACLMAATAWYMPLAISVDNEALRIHRLLRTKALPLADITSIVPCPPTMGEKRTMGSGGWYGYWGWFSQRDTGRYFAYYGKASDCFMITLRSGRKYLLGCANPGNIINAINSRINALPGKKA